MPLPLLQLIGSFAVIFLSTISSPRIALLVVSNQPNIPSEFLMASLALTDCAAIGFVAVSGLRLLVDKTYRVHCGQILNAIQIRFGGFVWLALLFWVGLSTRWADNASLASFNGLHVALSLITAIVLASLCDHEGAMHRLLWMLVVSLVLQALVGILQVVVQGPLGLSAIGEVGRFPWDLTNFYRARGLSEHPNYLGGCLVLGLFACLILLRSPTAGAKTAPRAMIIGIMALLLAGMTGTLSRSAFVGAFIGALPLLAWAIRHISVRRLIITGIGVGLVVTTIGTVALRGDFQNAQSRLLGAREFFFGYTLTVIKQAPIIGVGGGNLMVRIGANEGDNGQDLLPVHNVYVFILAELGLPGTILFLIGCAIVLARSRLWQIGQIFSLRIWGCAFLAICVIMLFDNYFWAIDPHRMTFFWVLGIWWGCAVWSEQLPDLYSKPTQQLVTDRHV